MKTGVYQSCPEGSGVGSPIATRELTLRPSQLYFHTSSATTSSTSESFTGCHFLPIAQSPGRSSLAAAEALRPHEHHAGLCEGLEFRVEGRMAREPLLHNDFSPRVF
jgi:hypothetical protein